MKKLKLDISDPETRAVWETALKAREEVAAWPAWKRGEPSPIEEAIRTLLPEEPVPFDGFDFAEPTVAAPARQRAPTREMPRDQLQALVEQCRAR